MSNRAKMFVVTQPFRAGKTAAAAVIFMLGLVYLAGCTPQAPMAASSPPPYSINTPLDVLKTDPKANLILVRDAPGAVLNWKFATSGNMSLKQIAALSGGVSSAQLAKAQTDLVELWAEELATRSTVSSYAPPVPMYPTSFVCEDGNTLVQNAVCENRQLAALDVQLAALYRAHLGAADVFERDQLLAAQRAWVLSLPAACGLTVLTVTPLGPPGAACLARAYQAQIAVMTNWPMPAAPANDPQAAAIAHYVSYKLLDDRARVAAARFDAAQPAMCADIASRAPGALSDDGSIDPTRLAGAQEIAGSHGPASGVDPQGGSITVDLYRAGLYGGYQIRARSVSRSGATAPMLGPLSVGNYVQSLPNGGGRYVSFASQTGDYGAIDVFTLDGQLVALLTDTIGYNSPAPPGEAAVAALYRISQNTASPACLFETFLMPPPLSMGTFGNQPSLTPFLTLIDTIQGVPSSALGPSDRQDSAYFSDDTRWTMLNMPLLTLAQAKAGNWTGWLRDRHDQVLDSLYAWSRKSPQNQALFNKLFALLQPAAIDLDTIYVQQQGMTPADAEQATALAMMELLYQSMINFAPGLGSGPAVATNYQNYKPRYPILANPQ